MKGLYSLLILPAIPGSQGQVSSNKLSFGV